MNKYKLYFAPLLFLLIICLSSFVACVQEVENDNSQAAENVEIVSEMYESFENGDIPAVVEKMDSEIIWNEAENYVYADGNPYVGSEDILNGVFARMGEEWDEFNITDQSIYPVGDDMVLATGRYNATYKESEKTMDAQHSHIWWLEDGKVTRFQQYTDTKQAWDTVNGD